MGRGPRQYDINVCYCGWSRENDAPCEIKDESQITNRLHEMLGELVVRRINDLPCSLKRKKEILHEICNRVESST